MSYDAERSRLLCKQTDLAGSAATLAEIERANQLQRADDHIAITAQKLAALNALTPRLRALSTHDEQVGTFDQYVAAWEAFDAALVSLLHP